jgi:hypothetical protein
LRLRPTRATALRPQLAFPKPAVALQRTPSLCPGRAPENCHKRVICSGDDRVRDVSRDWVRAPRRRGEAAVPAERAACAGTAGRCGRSLRFPDNSRFHGLNGNLNSRFGDRQIRVKILIRQRILDRYQANRRNFPVISRLHGNLAAVTELTGIPPLRRRPIARASSPSCAASPGQRGALEPDATVSVDHPEQLQSARPGRIAAVARPTGPIGPEPRIIAGRRSDVDRRRLQHQRLRPRRGTRCRHRLLRLGRQAAHASDQRRGDGRPGFSHRRSAGVKAP